MINQAVVEKMASEIDLTEYIGATEDLREQSGKYYAICPFHAEKTPSLCVFPNGTWYCFGCGKGGDIYAWIMNKEKKTFTQAVDKVGGILNYHEGQYAEAETIGILRKLRNHRKKEKITACREYLNYDTDYNLRFADEIPEEWLEEGISAESMRRYEVRIDKVKNRIVYPVYDNDMNLIGVKGRTRIKSYKELGLPKYMNYYKINTTDFFAGMKQARKHIEDKNEIIIFEGIKSCMKAADYGYYNTVAAETSALNDEQVNILIKMHVKNIVIAFDSDVSMGKIQKCTKNIRRFANVYVVQSNQLGDKVAPVDLGTEVWEEVYNRRKKL